MKRKSNGQRLPLTVERRVILVHDRETGESTGYFEIPAIQLVADGRIKNLKAGQTVRITIDEWRAPR